MDLVHSVVPFFDGASYLGIFLLIIFSGYILPVPEELFLIIVGYLIYAGVFPLVPVVIVALLATFVHDQILFYLGKTEHVRAKWFLERFSQVTLLNHDELVKHHIYRVIFYSRFIPYVRLAGPLLAGSEKVPWRKFALVDIAALVLYAPISIAIGYYFHGALEVIITKLTFFHHLLTIGVVVSIGLMLGWYIGTKLELEKKIISIIPVKPLVWAPLLFVLLMYSGYVIWSKPDVKISSLVTSEIFIEKSGKFTFSIPNGFTIRPASLLYGEESLVVITRENNAMPDEISIRVLPIDSSLEFEDVLFKDFVYGGDESPAQSLNEFKKIAYGRYEYYFIRRKLKNEELSVTYYLVREKEVYAFTLREGGIVDGMDPTFDELNTSGHLALIALLKSLTVK